MSHSLSKKFTFGSLLLFALPTTVMMVVMSLYTIVDGVFVSRFVSTNALSSVNIVYPVINIVLGISVMLSTGSNAIVAKKMGEGRPDSARETFTTIILLNIIIGLVFAVLGNLAAVPLSRMLGASDLLLKDCVTYLRWQLAFAPSLMLQIQFQMFFVTEGKPGIGLFLTLLAGIANAVLDYVLIVPMGMGIAGAAIGSSLAELVSVIFFIIYTWKRIDCRKYALNILPKFQGKTLKRILNVSVWTMIQNFVSLSTWFMFFLFVEHLGERSLAIANIIRNVSGIPFMIAMAFASTCGSLVSNLIGAGEQDCVRGTIKQHIRIGYIFVLPILVFFCLFPDLILRIYTDIPDLRAASVPSLWVLCSAYLVLVPANVYFQSVSGTGNTRTALAMELCVLAIYVTYSAYFIMYLRMDVAFAWTTECVYGIFTLMFCYWYMKKGNWQKKQI